MKTLPFNSVLGLLMFLFVIWTLTGCKKDDDNGPDDPYDTPCRIDEVVVTSPDDDGTTILDFTYDAAERLIRIDFSDPDMPDESGYYSFFYSGDRIVESYDLGGIWGSGERVHYLNDEGYIVESEADDGTERSYEYNADGYLIWEYYNDPDDDENSYEVTYEVSDGNLISAIKEYDNGGLVTYTYDYTDEANAGGYHNFIYKTLDFVYNGLPFGEPVRNLIREERWVEDGETSYFRYTYEMQGKLVKRRTMELKLNGFSPVFSTYEYSYLCD